MRKVIQQVWVIVAVGKVIDPTGGIRIDRYNVGVQEIPAGSQGTGDGGVDHLAIFRHIGCIFGYHDLRELSDIQVGVTGAFG